MAEIAYVDWDGLLYYDSKIKTYINNKLQDELKVGDPVDSIDKLPDPSFNTLNYIYEITQDFIIDSIRFDSELIGKQYPAGTWVKVSALGDPARYLYTIFTTSKENSDLLEKITDLETDIKIIGDKTDRIEDNYALKSSIPTKLSDLENDQQFVQEPEVVSIVQEELLKISLPDIDIELDDYVKKDDLASLIPSEYITESELQAEGFLKEHQSLVDYAKKEDLPVNISELNNDVGYITDADIANKADKSEIIKNTSELINDAQFTTQSDVEEKLKDYALKNDLDIYLTADDLNGYSKFSGSYNDLTDKPNIPSIEGLASEQWVENKNYLVAKDIENKANKILFEEDYLVTNPIGDFQVGDSVKNLTLVELFTRLLGLKVYDGPGDIPADTSPVVADIISNQIATLVMDGSGNLVQSEYTEFYRQFDEVQGEQNSDENYFYQIIDSETGELIESGYQVQTVYDTNEYLTVALPNTVKNFRIEKWNPLATGVSGQVGAWDQVTFKLSVNSNLSAENYTIWSANEAEVNGGDVIRIIIDD